MFLEHGWILLSVAGGYLLGSLPTGYLAGQWLAGIDIRTVGSGSTGATNILRTLGKIPALTVLLIDAGKGMAAVALPWTLEPDQPAIAWWMVLCGLMAVVGHSRSCWLGWRGGKSVATSLGVLFALSWPTALASLAIWGSLIGLTRIVSIASVMAALLSPLWMILWGQPLPYILFAVAGGLYVLATHRRNLERLMAGTEPRIGQSHSTPSSEMPQ